MSAFNETLTVTDDGLSVGSSSSSASLHSASTEQILLPLVSLVLDSGGPTTVNEYSSGSGRIPLPVEINMAKEGADSDQVLLLQEKLAAMEEEKNYWKHSYFLMEEESRDKIKEVNLKMRKEIEEVNLKMRKEIEEVNLKMRKEIEEVQEKLTAKEGELLHLKAALMAKGDASRKTAPFMSTPFASLQGKLDEVNGGSSVSGSDSTGNLLSCQSGVATAEAQKEMNRTYDEMKNWIGDTVATSSVMESNGLLQPIRKGVEVLSITSKLLVPTDLPSPAPQKQANAEKDDRNSCD